MKKWYVLFAGCLLWSGSANGVDMYTLGSPNTVSFGGHWGYAQGDLEEGDKLWGLQLTYQATRMLSVEFAGSFLKDSLSVPMASEQVRFTGETQFDILALSLTGRAELPVTSRLALYGGAGFSYYLFDPDGARSLADPSTLDPSYHVASFPLSVDASNPFGVHLTLGLKVALSQNIELFADYRQVLMDRTVDFEGTINTEKDVVRSVKTGAGETASVSEEVVTVGQSFTDTATVDDSYNHGIVRIGINFYY